MYLEFSPSGSNVLEWKERIQFQPDFSRCPAEWVKFVAVFSFPVNNFDCVDWLIWSSVSSGRLIDWLDCFYLWIVFSFWNFFLAFFIFLLGSFLVSAMQIDQFCSLSPWMAFKPTLSSELLHSVQWPKLDFALRTCDLSFPRPHSRTTIPLWLVSIRSHMALWIISFPLAIWPMNLSRGISQIRTVRPGGWAGRFGRWHRNRRDAFSRITGQEVKYVEIFRQKLRANTHYQNNLFRICSSNRSMNRLIDRSFDWLIGCSIDWLIDWLIDSFELVAFWQCSIMFSILFLGCYQRNPARPFRAVLHDGIRGGPRGSHHEGTSAAKGWEARHVAGVLPWTRQCRCVITAALCVSDCSLKMIQDETSIHKNENVNA